MIFIQPPSFHPAKTSQVLDEELDGRLERTFLAGLDLRLAQVPADGKAMGTTREVLTRVAGRVSAVPEQVVRHLLLLRRESDVMLARVDQDRVVGLGLERLCKSLEIRAPPRLYRKARRTSKSSGTLRSDG
jgi:hypothetical protein